MKDKELELAQKMMEDCKAVREEIRYTISSLFDDIENRIQDAYVAGYNHAKNNTKSAT